MTTVISRVSAQVSEEISAMSQTAFRFAKNTAIKRQRSPLMKYE